MFVNYNNFDWDKVQELLISMFCICFNFEFIYYFCCGFQPPKCFFSDTFELVVMFEWCLTYCMLCILWLIVCWKKWNNYALFRIFIITRPINFAGVFMPFNIFTLQFTGRM